jgi:hypothetical protein
MDVLIKSVINIIEDFDGPLILSMKSLAKLSCKKNRIILKELRKKMNKLIFNLIFNSLKLHLVSKK